MLDYAKELNPQQLAAVQADPGPILVIAGAGSGKTRTLTYRVAWLVENGLPPDRLLLLTFTNKAAREMLDRVASLFPLDGGRVWGGTFHSVANRILRRHARALDYRPNYAILDREDSKDLLGVCIPEAGVDIKERRFPKPDVILEALSLAANTDRTVEEIVAAQFPWFEEVVPDLVRIAKLYAERKRQANAMDYDDLLLNLRNLLEDHPEIAELYQRQFLAILVDEFQDTNRLQSDLVDLLAARRRHVMVVGDDAQSIYSWRGANFRNIMEFPKRYPDARIFKIEQNYRSTPQILTLANHAIRANTQQFHKELQPTRKDGPPPQLVPVYNSSEQAAFVAGQLLELRDQGVELREMAVLYRSHFHSMELQMELTRRNIPFTITSGLRFFEQAHIKDLAAHLKLAVNPRDELAFKRLVRMLPKIGVATASKLWAKLLPIRSTGGDDPPPLALGLRELASSVPKIAQKPWQQFSETMAHLSDSALFADPARMIRMVLDSGYEDYLKASFDNYLARRDDLTQLAGYATRFKDVAAFLSDLALLSNVESEDAGVQPRDNESVRLSTVHQAKGQEFAAVFVITLNDGAFPNTRALEAPEGEEEERRLFYVAVTRARDELYLCFPQIRLGNSGGDAFQKPSRFLSEIPATLYEKVAVEPAYGRFADD
ncbi:MAG: ATP-dependent helicase [Verrucomicrobiae bacterium]|nr:ATP-dependent helicase [Verrucomicrobiae bacterium]